MHFLIEAIAFLITFTYSSFFEWFVHRHLMHEKRFPLHEAFHGHTVVHHQLYRWDSTFEAKKGIKVPPHVALRWTAFPAMLAPHLLLFALIQHFTGWPIFWGAILGNISYFVGYEYTHFLMHVPKGHYVERYRWFRFMKEHHRLHHKYYLRNINVFLPLGDIVMGTLVTSEGWRSKQAKRQRTMIKRKSAPKKVPAKSEA